MNLIKATFISIWQYFNLVIYNKLHLRRERKGRAYHISGYGEYRVFRETVSLDNSSEKPVVIVIGFRLKLLGRNKFLHWLFQKVCIMTTPFWCGFKGFKVKLWMVKTNGYSYMGIYDWAGKDNAQTYVNWLTSILKPLSTTNSVWYKIHTDNFEKFLETREYRIP